MLAITAIDYIATAPKSKQYTSNIHCPYRYFYIVPIGSTIYIDGFPCEATMSQNVIKNESCNYLGLQCTEPT